MSVLSAYRFSPFAKVVVHVVTRPRTLHGGHGGVPAKTHRGNAPEHGGILRGKKGAISLDGHGWAQFNWLKHNRWGNDGGMPGPASIKALSGTLS